MVGHLAKADPAGAEFPRRGPRGRGPLRTHLYDDDARSQAARVLSRFFWTSALIELGEFDQGIDRRPIDSDRTRTE